MKIIKILLIAMLSFAIAINLIGYMLPGERKLEKSYQFKSGCDQVWKFVHDISGQPNWRSDIQKVEWIDSNSEIWKEIAKSGNQMVFQTKSQKDQEFWEMSILEPKGLEGGWIGKFRSTPEGCFVIFKESISIKNPIDRIFSYLFFDMNATMNLYLEDLSKALREEFYGEKIQTNLD